MAEDEHPGGNRQITWPQVFIGLAVIVGAFMLYGVLTADDDTPTATTEVSSSPLVDVTYRVIGSARSVSITMETPTGTSQASNRSVPLARKGGGGRGLTMTFERGAFVYLSAQNEGDSGKVTCIIEGSDGDEISRASSEGAYVIATCDGEAR